MAGWELRFLAPVIAHRCERIIIIVAQFCRILKNIGFEGRPAFLIKFGTEL